MRNLLSFILFIAITFPIFGQEETNTVTAETSTYYFIRHAEKDRSDASNKNPNLIQKGVLRAAKWSYVLGSVEFDAIYSTDYNRTKQTAAPTAEKQNLNVTIYNPRNIDAKAFLETTKGQTVLIVGHSNTTPMFVNALLGSKKYEDIKDDNNANLYIVTISGSGEISDTVLLVD